MTTDFRKIFKVRDVNVDATDGAIRHLHQLANLLVEANPTMTRQQAVHHLLHDKSGAALVARTKRKGKPMTWETLEKFVKSEDGYFLEFAKSVTDIGNKMDLTEEQFTKLATAAAQRDYPGLRPDAAFARYFEAHQVVRHAYAVVKGLALVMPVYVGGDAALAVDDPADALAQIEELVEQQRAAHPELSKAQVFAKVYAANPELARRERAQNRPRA